METLETLQLNADIPGVILPDSEPPQTIIPNSTQFSTPGSFSVPLELDPVPLEVETNAEQLPQEIVPDITTDRLIGDFIVNQQALTSFQNTGTGLTGEYFDKLDLTNSVFTRTDATVDFDWGLGSPNSAIEADSFSVRWTGQLQPLYTETYTFHTLSNDGVRLWVNGELLIDQWVPQDTTEHSGTISLEAGQFYDIKLEYYERNGNAVSQLLWSSDSQLKEIIPTSALYPRAIIPPTPADSLELQFITDSFYNPGETINFVGKVSAENGIVNLERIDFFLQEDRSAEIDIPDATEFSTNPENPDSAFFNYQLSDLEPGRYQLTAVTVDARGNVGEPISQNFTVLSVGEGEELSDRVLQAIASATNLDNYTPEQLAATQEWVVSVKDGASSQQLANDFGAENLGETRYIPNTYFWEFSPETDPQEIANSLSEQLNIEFAYPLVPLDVEFFSPTNEPNFNTQWHLQNAQIPQVWDNYQGEGVVIGVVDDGFDIQHPDLAPNYLADLSWDFDQEDSDPSHALKFEFSQRRSRPISTIFDNEYRLHTSHISGLLSNVEVTLNIKDADIEDLEIYLISPEGTKEQLFFTGSGSGEFTTSTSAFNGQNPNSHPIDRNYKWTLEIENEDDDDGVLRNWSLTLETSNFHGTAVTGIVAASGNNQLLGTGVVPSANWAGLRLGADGFRGDEIAESLSHENQEIDIYNNSWGQGFLSELPPLGLWSFENGTAEGRDGLGSIYVFAAGNDGHLDDNVNYNGFANSRHNIAVAAIDSRGKQSFYSNPGAPVLISAYSNNVQTFFAVPEPEEEEGEDEDGFLQMIEDGQTVSNLLRVSGVEDVIADVSVNLDISHRDYQDLKVVLISPSGTEVELFADAPFTEIDRLDRILSRNVIGVNPSISLTSSAQRRLPKQGDRPVLFIGTFQPSGDLTDFIGEDANGEWALKITDKSGNSDSSKNQLKKWSLNIHTNGIVTTDIQGETGYSRNEETRSFGGTSAAAPLVSGVTALMLEANPNLSWRDVQQILIETADRNDPSDEDWTTNGAGYHINHKYGFGAINAEKAVEMAVEWRSLGKTLNPEKSLESPQITVDKLIPDYNGISPRYVKDTVDFEAEDTLTVEWAEIYFQASHDYRGDLEVVLVHTYEDPETGESKTTESVLAPSRYSDGGVDYDWWFTTARHWGEPSTGEWTLQVADLDEFVFGVFESWQLNLFGTGEDVPEVALSSPDSEASESGDLGEFSVTLNEALAEDLTVRYAIEGTASNGLDYVEGNTNNSLNDTIAIPAGTTEVMIPIEPVDDVEVEENETLILRLLESENYQIVDEGTAIVTIADNDVESIVTISATDSEASEDGDSGKFLITRTGNIDESLTVSYEMAGDAISGTDYADLGSIVIPAGESSVTVPLTPIDDDEVEGEETVVVNLVADVGYQLADESSVQVSIADNDSLKPDLVILNSGNPNPIESGEAITYTLIVSNDGPADAKDVWVRDTLPIGFSLASVFSSGDFTADTSIPGVVHFTGGSLDSSEIAFMTIQGTVSTTPGDITNIAIVDPDDVIPESNETNNISEFTTTVNPPEILPLADLESVRFFSTDFSFSAGDNFNVTSEIVNNERVDAGTFDVAFYLSEDRIISASEDYFLGSEVVSTLAANDETSVVADLILPNAGDAFWNEDGIYVIGTIVDSENAIAESDENNNANTGAFKDYIEIFISNTDPNQPPIATDDMATLTAGTTATIAVLANDNDPDNDSLTLTGVGTATSGEVSTSGNNAIYTPNPTFIGTDSFTYSVSDGQGGTDTATVSLTVEAEPVELFAEMDFSLMPVRASAQQWGDYDNDGDLDILLTGDIGFAGGSKIYRNDNGTFTDIGADLVPAGDSAVAWGDYDNDGDLDLIITGSPSFDTTSKIYRNDGGNFVDIGANIEQLNDAGLDWGDYDNDGDLDLILIGERDEGDFVAKIYRNDNGEFIDIAANLQAVDGTRVDWGDYDNDGDLDILLAGNTGGLLGSAVSKVYRNDGDEQFTDINANLTGVTLGTAEWGDYDNDSDLDILLTGRSGPFNGVAKVYRNDGNDSFVDAVAGLPIIYGGAAWGDYDNDGDLDILLTGQTSVVDLNGQSKLYRNDNGSFSEVSDAIFQGVITSDVEWGDYDGDGDLDILLTGASGLSGIYTKVYSNNTIIANTAPNVPDDLDAIVNESSVTLSWNAATDTETPQPGLTYNLRVGTTSGGSQIMSPMSLTDGTRLVGDRGNVNHNTSWTLNNLEPGTYYWSVQTIDSAFAGSAFATEGTFTIAEVAAPNIVTNTNDSGAGSLREAIVWANNNPGRDTILFDIPGDGPHTISPVSALPEITEAVLIDGWSENGDTPPDLPLIELSGSNAGNSDGLRITGSNVEVRGLVINGWQQSGIVIDGTTDNWIYGNFIGTNLDGTEAIANSWSGLSVSGNNNIIGTNGDGTADTDEANLISGNSGSSGVFIVGDFNIVAGNHIGTNLEGTEALPNNLWGVWIGVGSNNIIGTNGDGTADAAEANLISGNSSTGVVIYPDFNIVAGNLIGTNKDGTAAIPNGGDGVSGGGSNNRIGGTNAGEGNIIAFNNRDGVALGGSIQGNAIFSNTGIGIDLGNFSDNDGVTANDLGDSDTGVNNLQNFPELTSAASDDATTTIEGTFNSTANTTFTLEFFSNSTLDESGYGEGETFLSSQQVTTDSEGNASFTANIPTPIQVGHFITATATDPNGNTSEFSQGVEVSPEKVVSPNIEFSQKFIAPDGASDNWFGNSVAVYGDYALIASHGDDDNGFNSGSAYLFNISSGNLVQKFLAPDGAINDWFGRSVAVYGDYALIASIGSGSAYLFNVTSGELVQKFLAPNSNSYFGKSVALNENHALIGSWGDDENGIRSGSAYLFDIISGNLIQKFLAPDGAVNDFFGYSVAINENYALIGSLYDDDNGFDSGSAYLFNVTSGDLVQKFLAPDGASGDSFGISVAINENYALIGSNGDSDNGSNSGSAYLFDITSGDFVQKFLAPDGASRDSFGGSVALNGNYALISSVGDEDNGTDSGSAYLFDITSGDFVQKFLAPDGASEDFFSRSVALNGDSVLISSDHDDDNGSQSGSAYLFTIE